MTAEEATSLSLFDTGKIKGLPIEKMKELVILRQQSATYEEEIKSGIEKLLPPNFRAKLAEQEALLIGKRTELSDLLSVAEESRDTAKIAQVRESLRDLQGKVNDRYGTIESQLDSLTEKDLTLSTGTGRTLGQSLEDQRKSLEKIEAIVRGEADTLIPIIRAEAPDISPSELQKVPSSLYGLSSDVVPDGYVYDPKTLSIYKTEDLDRLSPDQLEELDMLRSDELLYQEKLSIAVSNRREAFLSNLEKDKASLDTIVSVNNLLKGNISLRDFRIEISRMQGLPTDKRRVLQSATIEKIKEWIKKPLALTGVDKDIEKELNQMSAAYLEQRPTSGGGKTIAQLRELRDLQRSKIKEILGDGHRTLLASRSTSCFGFTSKVSEIPISLQINDNRELYLQMSDTLATKQLSEEEFSYILGRINRDDPFSLPKEKSPSLLFANQTDKEVFVFERSEGDKRIEVAFFKEDVENHAGLRRLLDLFGKIVTEAQKALEVQVWT